MSELPEQTKGEPATGKKLHLPRGTTFIAGLVVIGLVLTRRFPEYKDVVMAVNFIFCGTLLVYLARTAPNDWREIHNREQPAFYRMPSAGKHGRKICIGVGMALVVAGVFMLVKWIPA